jgi:hypothetical protein
MGFKMHAAGPIDKSCCSVAIVTAADFVVPYKDGIDSRG